ncbi:MAG TPA: hypothetical protein VJH34_01315 [archaeon]|nr:hypothetical protein [archaeon]
MAKKETKGENIVWVDKESGEKIVLGYSAMMQREKMYKNVITLLLVGILAIVVISFVFAYSLLVRIDSLNLTGYFDKIVTALVSK